MLTDCFLTHSCVGLSLAKKCSKAHAPILQREAEQEAARLSAIQDARQQEFEQREALAAAELKQRLEIEQRTIAEQQQRQRAELERQRR